MPYWTLTHKEANVSLTQKTQLTPNSLLPKWLWGILGRIFRSDQRQTETVLVETNGTGGHESRFAGYDVLVKSLYQPKGKKS